MQTWLVPLLAAALAASTTLAVTLLRLRSERQIDEGTARRSEDARLKLLVDRYQEPLVRAAYDLQSRLYNILVRDVLHVGRYDGRGEKYLQDSTVWLFGQYFGWVEILRREAQFLALPGAEDRAALQAKLYGIASACSSDTQPGGALFRVFRSDQRALGELMIVDGRDADGQPRSDCLGYAAFVARLADETSNFDAWFGSLRQDVKVLANAPNTRTRLPELQRALIELIGQIDPQNIRFPAYRDKVA